MSTETKAKKMVINKKPTVKLSEIGKERPTVKKAIEKVAAKKEKKDNELSVAQVATECGVDAKVARAKMRRAGYAAIEGRWPTMQRNSKEHKELVEFLKPTAKKDD